MSLTQNIIELPCVQILRKLLCKSKETLTQNFEIAPKTPSINTGRILCMQRHYNDCEATPQSQRRRDGDFPYSSRLQLCVPGFQFSWVQKQMTYFLPVLIYFSPFLISHFFLSSFILRFLPIIRLFLTSFLLIDFSYFSFPFLESIICVAIVYVTSLAWY